MCRSLYRPLCLLGALLAGPAVAPAQTTNPYPEVYIASETQAVAESASQVSLVIELSRHSFLPVVVPVSIDPASTAVPQEELDAETGDFFIEEDLEDEDEDGIAWDPATGSGTFTFDPGVTRLTLEVTIHGDTDREEDETLIFRYDPAGVTVARPVLPQQVTFTIEDDDTGRVGFAQTEFEVDEGRSINFTIEFDAAFGEDVEIPYSLSYEGGASAADVDIEESTESPLEVDEGASRANFSLRVFADNEVESDDETIVVTLGNPVGQDENVDATYTADPAVARVRIRDDDPVVVRLQLDDDEEPFDTLTEGENRRIVVELSGVLDEDSEIPYSFSGDAIFGDRDDDLNTYDFHTVDSESPLTIAAGDTAGSVTIVANNDDLVEETETLTFTLGTPVLPDSDNTPPPLGDETMFTIEIEDNDPVSISWVVSNPDFDPAEDESDANPRFLPVDSLTLAEGDGGADLFISLTDDVAYNLDVDIEIVSEGTTATLFDPDFQATDEDEEQEWDFTLQGVAGRWDTLDEPRTTLLRRGIRTFSVGLVFNDDEEDPVIYGQEPGPDIEPPETIVLRISAVDPAEDGAEVAIAEGTLTLTVREFPDIDVSALFSGREPLKDNWVGGEPPLNPLIGAHEVDYLLQLQQALDPEEFRGYRSYKIGYKLTNYDVDNPDAPTNDPLRTNPRTPDENEAFNYFVYSPFALRYPTGRDRLVLREGTEPEDEFTFTDENADIIDTRPYVLQLLNLPVLNPVREEARTDYFELQDPLDLSVAFTNDGVVNFPAGLLDPAQNPEAARIFISRADVPPADQFLGTSTDIFRFERLEDGSIHLVVDARISNRVQIQYLDGDELEWRVAQPPRIEANGSQLFWIDRGPPTTHRHPEEVDMRLYRAVVNP